MRSVKNGGRRTLDEYVLRLGIVLTSILRCTGTHERNRDGKNYLYFVLVIITIDG